MECRQQRLTKRDRVRGGLQPSLQTFGMAAT
jgi:hypothetical protein